MFGTAGRGADGGLFAPLSLLVSIVDAALLLCTLDVSRLAGLLPASFSELVFSCAPQAAAQAQGFLLSGPNPGSTQL